MRLFFAEISQVGFCYGSCWTGKLVPDLVATNHHLDLANSPPKGAIRDPGCCFCSFNWMCFSPTRPRLRKLVAWWFVMRTKCGVLGLDSWY